MSALASDLNLSLKSIVERAVTLLNDSDVNPFDLYATILHMTGEAGKIATLANEYRYGVDNLDNYQNAFWTYLSTLTALYARLLFFLDTYIDDVAKANIQKLFKRRDEGVLRGDGDNRSSVRTKDVSPTTQRELARGLRLGKDAAAFTGKQSYRIQNSYQDSGWEETGHEYLSLDDAFTKAEWCASKPILYGMVRIVDADGRIIKTFGAGETSREAA
jgi:hypothetical protein